MSSRGRYRLISSFFGRVNHFTFWFFHLSGLSTPLLGLFIISFDMRRFPSLPYGHFFWWLNFGAWLCPFCLFCIDGIRWLPFTLHLAACFTGFEPFHIPHAAHVSGNPIVTSLYKFDPAFLPPFTIFAFSSLCALTFLLSLSTHFFFRTHFNPTLNGFPEGCSIQDSQELDHPEVRTTKQTFAIYHWRLKATPEFLSLVISTYHVLEKVHF